MYSSDVLSLISLQRLFDISFICFLLCRTTFFDVDTLPSKFKKVAKYIRTNTLFKTKYEEIEDGDALFEDLPNLVYSKYSDDYVTFKKIKDMWNADILNRKKKLNTYC